MSTRIGITLSVAFFFTAAFSPLVAVEHPHPIPQTTQMSQLPQNQSRSASPSGQAAKKEVSPADIAAGIKKGHRRQKQKIERQEVSYRI